MVMNHIINIPYKLALQYMNFIYFIVQLISSISYVSQKPCGSNINVCSKNGFFCFVCYRKVYCSLLTLTRLFLVSKLKMQKTNKTHLFFPEKLT